MQYCMSYEQLKPKFCTLVCWPSVMGDEILGAVRLKNHLEKWVDLWDREKPAHLIKWTG